MAHKFTLTLLEAVVSLYPADGSGAPVVDAPVWTGIEVADLTVQEKWIKSETRPSGARTPRKRALVAQYQISFSRAWALRASTELGVENAVFEAREYVLDVVWTDEDSGNWHRRTFYNVTISEHGLASREVDGGFNNNQVWDAESVVEDGGLTGTSPPAIGSELPYQVIWVGEFGSVGIYRYAAATQVFTELVAGKATLEYSPTDRSGSFAITFEGVGSSILSGLYDEPVSPPSNYTKAVTLVTGQSYSYTAGNALRLRRFSGFTVVEDYTVDTTFVAGGTDYVLTGPAYAGGLPAPPVGITAQIMTAAPALEVSDDGVVHVSEMKQGTPTETPRVDFYYGATRVASVTAGGVFWSANFVSATPSAGAARFEIFAGSALALTLAGAGVTAGEFDE